MTVTEATALNIAIRAPVMYATIMAVRGTAQLARAWRAYRRSLAAWRAAHISPSPEEDP